MAIPRFERDIWLTTPMMRGDDVLMIQQRLVATGARLTQDGLYGRGTRAAVEAFQRANDLLADGIVGIITWSRLMAPLDGRAVATVQAPSRASDLLDRAALARPHTAFMGAVEWSVGPDGIALAGGNPPLAPSAEERKLVADVLVTFRQALTTALGKIRVPVELVVACICTESSGRPQAKRMEPGCDTGDPSRTPTRVSWGLMQTLLSTAREALRQPELRLQDLLEPEVSIRAGAAYIWKQARRTGFDPPLVAASYNAGSLKRNDGAANHWKLLQFPIGTPKHVDTFCRFFNAAMTTDAPLPDNVESMRAVLSGQATPATGAAPPVVAVAAVTVVTTVEETAPDPQALSLRQFQEKLRDAGLFAGAIDGQDSDALHEAMDRRFARDATAGRLTSGWEGWPPRRRRFAVEQSLILDMGIEVGDLDGLVGPQTMFAREAFQHQMTTGQPLRIPARDITPERPEPDSAAARVWPRQSECDRFYGQVGTNQTVLVLPYPMRLAWDMSKEITRFSCHEKVHDTFQRVFARTLSEYGAARIQQLRLDRFGGCLNVRRMRGGTQMSMHSWGIAVDLDPERNRLEMTHAAAAFARPEYEPFWRIVEGEGLVSLGRMRDFDWMHFQAARF